MPPPDAKKLIADLQAARSALRRERAQSRRRAALVDVAVKSNDLREVCAEMYRYFYRYFGVYKGDITILTDYDERDIYDRVGFIPREKRSTPADFHELARTHCEALRGLVEEQIFIGYLPDERKEIQRSHMIEQSMLECMVSKRSRIVNDVVAELSPKEVEEARRQRTLSWVNWVVLHPENSKLLAKLHMSFKTPKRLTQEGLSRRLKPFEDLLRYRILHTRDFKRVKYLSERDSLTGFYLRPVLARRLEQFLESAGRGDLRLSVSMIDLDFFKRFNDRYGHDVGDSVLRRFSQAVQAVLRGSDVVGRYGGEEFAALFPGASAEDALSILRRVFERVRD
ncbi:MAG: GGDEF domain-containing protein, partial [Elusimicrobiota bacterium]